MGDQCTGRLPPQIIDRGLGIGDAQERTGVATGTHDALQRSVGGGCDPTRIVVGRCRCTTGLLGIDIQSSHPDDGFRGTDVGVGRLNVEVPAATFLVAGHGGFGW